MAKVKNRHLSCKNYINSVYVELFENMSTDRWWLVGDCKHEQQPVKANGSAILKYGAQLEKTRKKCNWPLCWMLNKEACV